MNLDGFFFKGKKKSQKNSHSCLTNMLGFLIQDFFFIPENKIHASLRTCVEYFVQILKIDDSPRKSYEHGRFFLGVQLFVQKIKCWRACFTFSCSRIEFAGDPERRTVRLLHFLNDIAKKIIVFSNTLSKSRNLIPKIR